MSVGKFIRCFSGVRVYTVLVEKKRFFYRKQQKTKLITIYKPRGRQQSAVYNFIYYNTNINYIVIIFYA